MRGQLDMKKIQKWKTKFMIVAYLSISLFSPMAEKLGVNTWFFISGVCMVILTFIVVICYIGLQRRSEV